MGKPAWLGFDRMRRSGFERPTDLGEDGVLRGVTKIDPGILRRALRLRAFKMDEGVYLVVKPSVLASKPDDAEWYEWLQRPVWGRRDGVKDLDGWNSYWVHTSDRDATPCYCRWMYMDGEARGIPCKHLLAALHAEGHPRIVGEVRELQNRDALAELVEA